LTVAADGATTVAPLGLTIHAQRLSAADLRHVTSLLQTAQPPVVAPLASVRQADSSGNQPPSAQQIAQTMRAAAQPGAAVLGPYEGRIRVNVLGPIQIEGLAKPD